MKKKKPEIRFNGFEGEWVTTTLGECFLERVERSAEGELISVTISQGVVRASDLDRIDNSSNDKSNYKVVEVGDIAYNSMRMWQGACGYSLYKGICSPAYTVVIPQNNIDVVYCFYLFKRNETLQLFRVNSQGLTSDTWNLKYPAFSQIKCSFPSLSEQEKIGLFLTTLDKLIAKLEAKLDKLRKLKQALLEKMFVNINGGGYETPEIRFKGYTDKWEVKELREVAMRVVSKNEDNRVTLPLTISAQYGLISQTDFFNNRIAAKDVRKYYVIKKGEFAYNRSTSEGSPFGAVKRLDRYNAGVLSTLYLVFRISSEEIDSNYLVCYFSTDSWHKHIEENAAEGARNHGLLNITSEDFFTTPIKVPMKKEEQSKVALSIRTLENILSKTSTKLTKLRNIKQSLLQKMFA